MDEWPTVKLGDVADFLTGFPFKSANYSDAPSDPLLLRGDNVAQGTLRWGNAKRWPVALTADVETYRLQRDDVVLAMDRPWIEAGLKYATVTTADLPSFLVQRVARLRGTQHLSTRFLRYVIGSRDFTDYVLGVQTGTAVPHISGGQIKEYQFRLPPLPKQESIAEILGSLDDKIELNRRMNETLEATAQAIFRDWFVDFGPTRRKIDGATDPVEIMGGLVSDPHRARELAELFPARLGDDGLPEGWEERKLDEIASQHNATLTPLDHPTELFDHYSIPAFDKERNPTTELGAAILSNKTLVPSNAVLLSKLNPEIARVWLPNKNARHREICSTEFLAYTSKEPFGRALLYALFSSDPFRTLLCGMVTGTSKSHQRVSPKALAQRETLAVRGPEATQFEAVVGPLLDRVLHNRDENRTLAATRDLLLPKLMSGEIRVRDAEAVLEAAQ